MRLCDMRATLRSYQSPQLFWMLLLPWDHPSLCLLLLCLALLLQPGPGPFSSLAPLLVWTGVLPLEMPSNEWHFRSALASPLLGKGDWLGIDSLSTFHFLSELLLSYKGPRLHS